MTAKLINSSLTSLWPDIILSVPVGNLRGLLLQLPSHRAHFNYSQKISYTSSENERWKKKKAQIIQDMHSAKERKKSCKISALFQI